MIALNIIVAQIVIMFVLQGGIESDSSHAIKPDLRVVESEGESRRHQSH